MPDFSITDIHSHIIWGVDDGSESKDMSLEMIRMSVKQGVGRIICTPHFSPQFHRYTNETVTERFESLKESVAGECELYLGQEIFAGSEALEKLSKGELFPLAGSKYVLIEFYPWETIYNIRQMVREVVMMSYHPVLAHIERYKALNDISEVASLAGQGAYMQINFSSIAGSFWDKSASYCRNVLENGLVSFLGTDMHDTKKRSPRLTAALKWMDKNLDEDYVADICSRNIDKMIKNERI